MPSKRQIAYILVGTLICLTVASIGLGAGAVPTNAWIVGPDIGIGLIKTCAFGLCVTYHLLITDVVFYAIIGGISLESLTLILFLIGFCTKKRVVMIIALLLQYLAGIAIILVCVLFTYLTSFIGSFGYSFYFAFISGGLALVSAILASVTTCLPLHVQEAESNSS